MSESKPTTEAGRDAVRLRGLFGGETEERVSKWVALIEEQARRPALDVLRDAGEFGHNMAVPTLGHGRTFVDCPQTLCRRVRAALDAAQEDGS